MKSTRNGIFIFSTGARLRFENESVMSLDCDFTAVFSLVERCESEETSDMETGSVVEKEKVAGVDVDRSMATLRALA